MMDHIRNLKALYKIDTAKLALYAASLAVVVVAALGVMCSRNALRGHARYNF
jgi:hypothetical protein